MLLENSQQTVNTHAPCWAAPHQAPCSMVSQGRAEAARMLLGAASSTQMATTTGEGARGREHVRREHVRRHI